MNITINKNVGIPVNYTGRVYVEYNLRTCVLSKRVVKKIEHAINCETSNYFNSLEKGEHMFLLHKHQDRIWEIEHLRSRSWEKDITINFVGFKNINIDEDNLINYLKEKNETTRKN